MPPTETLPLAWITGAGGLIGSHLCRSGIAPAHWRLRALTRPELDLADFAAVTAAFRADRPALVIHCAALSKSPACQADPALAHQLNVEVTAHLTTLAADVPFVFLSTDLVFDGTRGNYTEADAVNPLSIYARTKVAAEELLARHPRHLILRTSLNLGRSPTGTRSFNEELIALWRAGKSLPLFTDEFRSPIPAAVTARAIWELVGQGVNGLLHLAGAERLSRYQIGQLVAARHPELNPRLDTASLRSFSGPPRPPNVTLDSSRAQARLSFPIPKLSEWMAQPHDD